MDEFISFFNSHPLIQFIALFLGIFGPIAGFIYWLIRSSKEKRATTNQGNNSSEVFVWINKNVIGKRRNELAKLAHSLNLDILKSDSAFIDDYSNIPLLAHDSWICNSPIALETVNVQVVEDVRAELKPPTQELPFNNEGKQFSTYSDAVYALLNPAVFKDNPQYRLLGFDSSEKEIGFRVSRKPSNYFSKIQYGKSLEYEFAKRVIPQQDIFDENFHLKDTQKPSRHPFRKGLLKGITNEGDFSHTVLLGGISSLTLIFDDETGQIRFLLHERSDRQGYASGVKHVIPAGEYQPLNISDSFEKDLPFWHNIMRELAEEVKNLPEFKAKEGSFIDYESKEPFSDFMKAKLNGDIKPYYVGFGLDPLSLQGEILTVLCFRKSSFEQLFGPEPLDKNEEGFLISEGGNWGLPFTEEQVNSVLEGNVLAAGHSLLKICLNHLDFFKAQFDSNL